MGSASMKYCILFAIILQTVYGGDINIGYSPATVRFGQASTLSLSELDNVIAASLGFTTTNALWKGVTVTSPFDLPRSMVVVEVQNNGAPVDREGISYPIRADVPLPTVMNILRSKLKSQSQKPLSFQDLEISKSLSEGSSLLKFQYLDSTDAITRAFLSQMKNLPMVLKQVKEESATTSDGQDVLFITIDSFYPLVEKFGVNSTEVKEAAGLIRLSLAQLIEGLRKYYNDDVIVASILNDVYEQSHIRRKRAFSDTDDEKLDVNLASASNEDYPVIFNIVLFFSIAMTLAIIAASASMAYMDPGRDSIIYRMTNPRMKKD